MLSVRLFGPFEASVDGEPMSRLRSRKGPLLLTLLILRAGQEVSRDFLCQSLWPESLLEQARLGLRQSLVDLRKALGSEAGRIEAIGAASLRFNAEDATIDVLEFDAAARTPNPDAAQLDAALALHRGPLLDGYREDVVIEEREARVDALISMLRRRAELAEGDAETAIRCLRRAAAASPLNEDIHRRLMRTLADAGNLAESLEAYRRLRAYLREELNAEPDAQTVEIYQSLRNEVQEQHRRSARTDRTVPATSDRLRLPIPLTSLVGREYEEASSSALLQAHRLVTLTGLGGIGKTRLALEVARSLGESAAEEEVVFASLAHVQAPQTMAEYLARSLGIADSIPLVEWIGTRRMLLVLDNCETTPDEAAAFAAEALAQCPGLRVLATSRTPLGVPGEVVLFLRPLTTSSEEGAVEEIAAAPACALMLDRMGLAPMRRMTDRDVRLAGEISRRLDGIPLAIELAAAQSRALPLEAILKRLDQPLTLLKSTERGRPARHLSMEAAIRGSYDLLDQEARTTFRTLGLFVGGFTLESAEAVCGGGDTLTNLTHLIDASLVHVASRDGAAPRYAMLETIRAFALERLAEAGESEAVRQRHFDEFLHCATEARSHLMGADQVAWIHRLDAEQENFRYALGHQSANQGFLELLNTLMFYWHLTSNTEEASRWFSGAFARTGGANLATVARMYTGAGTMAWHRMDLDNAIEWLELAVQLARESGDRPVLFSALNALGIALRMRGEFQRAYDATFESVGYIRETNDPPRLARGLANLGRAAATLGRFDEAESIFGESLARFQEVGDVRDHAHTQQSLAWCIGELGRHEESRRLHWQAIETLAGLEDPFRLAWSFCTLAVLCLQTDDNERGARLFGTVRALERQHHFEVLDERNPTDRERLATFRKRLGSTGFDQALAETADWTWQQGVELAREICGGRSQTTP